MGAPHTRGPAGGQAALSIVFAWRFPDRDFSGKILGNAYADIWPSAAAAAAALAPKLVEVVRDANAHHAAVAGREHPAPPWLKDMLLNQWAHVHMLMWSR